MDESLARAIFDKYGYAPDAEGNLCFQWKHGRGEAPEYYAWYAGDPYIILDGEFHPDYLTALVWWMENNPAGKKASNNPAP